MQLLIHVLNQTSKFICVSNRGSRQTDNLFDQILIDMTWTYPPVSINGSLSVLTPYNPAFEPLMIIVPGDLWASGETKVKINPLCTGFFLY